MGEIMINEYWLQMADETQLYVKKWFNPDQKPQAIVQLAHGMAEHIERYNDFASFLMKHHIVVYGNDHRGHGKTGTKQGRLGYFSDKNGFDKVTSDQYELTKYIKKEYPGVPVFLFGHSMGSFIARRYIQNYSDEVAGIILSGTGFFPSFTVKMGKILSGLLPAKKPTKLMNHLAFGSYQKKIKHFQTSFDWLSRDDKNVQIYLDDPLSGYIPTARFFYDLMDGLGKIHKQSLNQSIHKELPVLFISGEADPVGNYTKGIWKVAHLYQQIGLNQVQVMLFPGGRHELLHELNKEEVYGNVLRWLSAHHSQ